MVCLAYLYMILDSVMIVNPIIHEVAESVTVKPEG